MLPNPEIQLTREYFTVWRDGLLKQVDAIERILGISPRTSELRKILKESVQEYNDTNGNEAKTKNHKAEA